MPPSSPVPKACGQGSVSPVEGKMRHVLRKLMYVRLTGPANLLFVLCQGLTEIPAQEGHIHHGKRKTPRRVRFPGCTVPVKAWKASVNHLSAGLHDLDRLEPRHLQVINFYVLQQAALRTTWLHRVNVWTTEPEPKSVASTGGKVINSRTAHDVSPAISRV